MYAKRLGAERAERLNPLALLASQGVPLAFGSHSPVTGIDPWAMVRAAVNHRTASSGVSGSTAFVAATRGGWLAAGVRDGSTGTLVPGAAASYAVWDAGPLGSERAGSRVNRRSADPRPRMPALPALGPGDPSPRWLQTVHRGIAVYGDVQ
jgi:predicted amidohydrolase YtcJ